MMMSDRIGVMSEGRLVQVATPRELYEQPADPFVARFVGSVNELRLAQGDDPVWIRPERIDVLPHGTADGTGTRLDGTIRDVVYLGALVRFVVATDAGDVDVHRPSAVGAEAFAAGDAVTLRWE